MAEVTTETLRAVTEEARTFEITDDAAATDLAAVVSAIENYLLHRAKAGYSYATFNDLRHVRSRCERDYVGLPEPVRLTVDYPRLSPAEEIAYRRWVAYCDEIWRLAIGRVSTRVSASDDDSRFGASFSWTEDVDPSPKPKRSWWDWFKRGDWLY